MPLANFQVAFETALAGPTAVYEELATTRTFSKAGDFAIHDLCVLEGVLSRVWQIWCDFCRSALIESCMGTTDISGNVIAALPGAASEFHVSAAAIRAKKSQTVSWTHTNSVLRHEPTWGDVDSLLDIIAGISPTNSVQLNGMCTMASKGAKFLQLARNAAAHDNVQNRNELLLNSSAYSTYPIAHSCQALFWTEPTSQQYLISFALEQLRDASVFLVI